MDLTSYLRRLGLSEALGPDRASLETVHLAHLAAMPFENVDVRLGRPIRLDLESLQEKLIARRRGGYCFEHNTLFAAALGALGFDVQTLEARVRPRDTEATMPRTHMTLRVRADGDEYIADVGFGGFGPLLPVPLGGAVSEQPDGRYAVREEASGVFVLQHHVDGSWQDQYAFTLVPALPVDFQVANHFTATFPMSPFVNTLTVQRSTTSGRHILRGRSYATRVAGETNEREIPAGELPDLLRDVFGLDLSDEEALQALGDA